MRLIAKFVKALPTVEGESDNGAWIRGGMVVRIIDDYERLVALTSFGEAKTTLCRQFNPDDIVEVNFMPESREFGEKWYTDLRLLGCKRLGMSTGKEVDND